MLQKIIDLLLAIFAKRQPVKPVPTVPSPAPKVVQRAPLPVTPAEDTLARTIWAEARLQGVPGMTAVACVVLNRVLHPGWWGHDVVSVCRAREQFSCWNADDPQHDAIRATVIPGQAFQDALQIAAKAVRGELADVTHGADHYYAETIAAPKWARGKLPTYTCGTAPDRQFFFWLGLGG